MTIIVSLNISLGQSPLTKSDFAVNNTAIDLPVASALRHLAMPIRIDSLSDDEVGGFTVYHFKGLTIWAVSSSGSISSFDVSSDEFTTKRGLSVGDPLSKLDRLYGHRRSEHELNRLHDNYDVLFKDFDELKVYEYQQSENDVFFAIFYIKDSKVAKIYMYRGLGC